MKKLILFAILLPLFAWAQTTPSIWFVSYQENVNGQWKGAQSPIFDDVQLFKDFLNTIDGTTKRFFTTQADINNDGTPEEVIAGIHKGHWDEWQLIIEEPTTTEGDWEFFGTGDISYVIKTTRNGVTSTGTYTVQEAEALRNEAETNSALVLVWELPFHGEKQLGKKSTVTTPGKSYYIIKEL